MQDSMFAANFMDESPINLRPIQQQSNMIQQPAIA
jgi:hypothetical protein